VTDTDDRAARPIPATIPMPDHPVRQTTLFQIYVRLARPTAEWVTALGLFYAFVLGPLIDKPLDEGYLVQVLLFAGSIFGIRAFEKVKGVA
jgi:hypothetical protein